MDTPKKFQTKRSLGQHFLTTDTVPRWMCDAARVTAGDIILEIGPGTGALTKELLVRNAKVVALEADTRAIEVLQSEFPKEIKEGSLTIHHVDIRSFAYESLAQLKDHEYKVVSNIPYYLSGMLFREILEAKVQPSELVFLVQKEVAKRITCDLKRNEKESLLSLSVKAYGNPTYVKTVSRGHFAPAPNVDSAIILVQNISRDNFQDIDPVFFFELLHLGFGSKRKQLLGNLSKWFERNELINVFSTVSLPVSTRAEDVPLEKWLELVRTLAIHGN